MNITELEVRTREELLGMAKERGLTGVSNLKKEDLVLRLLQANAEEQGYSFRGGILEVMNEERGHGLNCLHLLCLFDALQHLQIKVLAAAWSAIVFRRSVSSMENSSFVSLAFNVRIPKNSFPANNGTQYLIRASRTNWKIFGES
jgi:hypothetical protein